MSDPSRKASEMVAVVSRKCCSDGSGCSVVVAHEIALMVDKYISAILTLMAMPEGEKYKKKNEAIRKQIYMDLISCKEGKT